VQDLRRLVAAPSGATGDLLGDEPLEPDVLPGRWERAEVGHRAQARAIEGDRGQEIDGRELGGPAADRDPPIGVPGMREAQAHDVGQELQVAGGDRVVREPGLPRHGRLSDGTPAALEDHVPDS
jgi:hypothetical protein